MISSSKLSRSRRLPWIHLLVLRAVTLSLLATGMPINAASPSPFGVPITKVTIAGGTHGNEYTGIWCIKAIENQREAFNSRIAPDGGESNQINPFREYPSLSIDTLLANPRAYIANKRFVDTDLNREFSVQKLRQSAESCSSGSLPYEAVRAKEIESILGRKGEDAADTDDPTADIVIDLHTTTTNMGITLIITMGDTLMSAAAAYVLHKCQTQYGYENVYCLTEPPAKRRDRTHLSSCGKHSFEVEVGPTPQGVVRHDVVKQTQAALNSLLEFLHLRNLELEHPSGGASRVLEGLRGIYPDGVPCYLFRGKIAWPSVPDNTNFPAWMVHESVQDHDFRPVRTGDPLFVGLDGTVVPYDGGHGDEVFLVFVNEGGYYYASSGTGVGVAVRGAFDWETGSLRR